MITYTNYRNASIRVLALAGATLFAPLASAQDGQCATDADCDDGFQCKLTGSSGCTGVDCPPNAPDCKPVECVPQDFYSCVPSDCKSDSDCAEDWVCHEQQSGGCSTPACPPGEKCDAAPSCDTTTESRCTPRYTLPCTKSSDCGAHFECVTEQQQQCACSGSGSTGSGTATGGAASQTSDAPEARDGGSAKVAPPPDQDCTCQTEDVTFCKVEQIPCANDTECPSTWQCVVEPGTAPGEPTTANDAGSASVEPGKAARLALVDAGAMDASVLVATLADAQVVALAVDASAAPSGYCQPPYYSGGPKGDDGTATGGDGEAPEEATDSGSVPVHQADAGGQGPSVTQEPGTEPTGAALDASAPSGENDAGKTDSEATQTSGDSGDDGCSCTVVGAESTQSRGALTAALGLLGGLVLRQSRGKRRQRAA